MGSALALAASLDEHSRPEEALSAWEVQERPIIEQTQRLSKMSSVLMSWPERPRSIALAVMARSRWVMRQRTLASYHRPVGAFKAVGHALSFPDMSHGWVVGAKGVIFHYHVVPVPNPIKGGKP